MSSVELSSLTDYATSLASSTKDTARANTLKNSMNSVGKTSSEDELLDACKQFESYLWEQILKEVDKSVDLFGTGDGDSYASSMVDMFSDNLIQEMSDKLVTGGDNSMAMKLYEQLKRNVGIDSVSAQEIDAKEMAEQAAASGLVSETKE